jgi:hypothetical protein
MRHHARATCLPSAGHSRSKPDVDRAACHARNCGRTRADRPCASPAADRVSHRARSCARNCHRAKAGRLHTSPAALTLRLTMVIGGEGAYAPSPLVTLLKLGVSVPAMPLPVLEVVVVTGPTIHVPGPLPAVRFAIDHLPDFSGAIIGPACHYFLRSRSLCCAEAHDSIIASPVALQKMMAMTH